MYQDSKNSYKKLFNISIFFIKKQYKINILFLSLLLDCYIICSLAL